MRLVDKQPCLPNIIEIPLWSLTKCMGDENKFLFFQCVQSCSLVHIFFQYNFKKLWKNFVNVIHKVRIKSGKKQARFWQESSRKGYRGNVVKRICWFKVKLLILRFHLVCLPNIRHLFPYGLLMASENSEPSDSLLNFYNSMKVTVQWTIK